MGAMPNRKQPVPDQQSREIADKVCVGRIGAPHGVRGLVKLHSFTENPEDIVAFNPLQDAEGRDIRLTIRGRQKTYFLAAVDGVENRDMAESLKGRMLYIDRARLPALEDEEDYYHSDLVGLEVRDPDGNPLGQVKAVQNFGAGDLLDVHLNADRRTILIPFTRDIVPEINLSEAWLRIDWVEGLIEPSP